MKDETVARDRIVTNLKSLALSTYEAEVYATLLAHPTMTASALCKETGISDTKIYYALAVSYTHLTLPTILLV